MAISVKLEAFEGPLDLLLHLIEKNKIDIYDIPIVEITAQYLDYIRQMQREDMNVMSEFLVMAATLIDIKCKKELTKKMAADLLKKGRTNVKGMWSEKKQAAYDAAVILDDTGGKYINFKLEFPKRKVGADGRK